MNRNDLHRTQTHQPSELRMRYIEARLNADAEAVLREVAYVLELTRRVKQDILSDIKEPEMVGA
jgi:hypothetical protein